MNVKRFLVLTVFALALTPSVCDAEIPTAVEHQNGWSAWAGWSSCDYHADNRQFRCQFNDGTKPSATIRITNRRNSKVQLTYTEYHGNASNCTTDKNPLIKAYYHVPAKGSVIFDVLAPSSTIGCRLGFVFGCDVLDADGKIVEPNVACKDVVDVEYRLWKGNNQ